MHRAVDISVQPNLVIDVSIEQRDIFTFLEVLTTAFYANAGCWCTSAIIVATQVKRDLGACDEPFPNLLASGLHTEVDFRGFY